MIIDTLGGREKTLDNRERTDWALGLGRWLIPYLFRFLSFEYIGLCILLKASTEAFLIGKEKLIAESAILFVMLFSEHFGFCTVLAKQNLFICKGA